MMKSLETEGAREPPATAVPSKHPLDDEGVGDYEAEGIVERRLHPLFKRLLVPQAFTAIICVYGVLASGAVNGLFASSGSSVQRSLGLSSMQWGLVATLYEVFLIAFQIFVFRVAAEPGARSMGSVFFFFFFFFSSFFLAPVPSSSMGSSSWCVAVLDSPVACSPTV